MHVFHWTAKIFIQFFIFNMEFKQFGKTKLDTYIHFRSTTTLVALACKRGKFLQSSTEQPKWMLNANLLLSKHNRFTGSSP